MIDDFNNSVNADRFNIRGIISVILQAHKYREIQNVLEEYLGVKKALKVLQGIVRFSFYIEPVKQPKIETTKFDVRWSQSLREDQRFCSYDECLTIFDSLIEDVSLAVKDDEKRAFLDIVTNRSLMSYELNLGYVRRVQDGNIHSLDNISFFWGDDIKQVYLLREFLLCSENPEFVIFFKRAYEKVIVKSYLTDRVLTGLYKTNREKRWECNPNSVHFALRQESLLIEAKLIKQICHFEGFPQDLRTILSENNIMVFSTEITKCPITLDLLSFDQFKFEIENPVAGKSSFQVGHLHPLKSLNENQYVGHTAENISWISSVGNRIQGELSAEETGALIFKIIDNYKRAGLIE
ncbi:hypothetical protein [Sphingobacterium suaedae]|uniref:Uncharacterized protein n=1 Tax=Sphingobacterium suaedae TaxID=1686402 RepID=A0ABW5KGM0_9SPHI